MRESLPAAKESGKRRAPILFAGSLAERVGFEPTYTLLGRNSISSRARYDLFGTSPGQKGTKVDGFPINYFAARRRLAGRRFV